MNSAARHLVDRLARLGPSAHAALDAALDQMSTTELAAIAYDWQWWARPKQIIPPGPWRSYGFLTGRGFGKTRSIAEWITGEVMAGRASRIGLCAQNELKTIEVMVEGESGLIAVAPPWFKAKHERGRVIWPNGAQAFLYTPEVPGAMRGPEHDLFWGSEFVAWPASTREEAFKNIRFGLRLGRAQLVWDTTPKKRHPMIRFLLDRARKRPEMHRIVRGNTRENVDNISPEELAELEADYAGTQAGREELEGEYLDDDEGALWKEAWISRARRDAPAELLRRIISVDPAISSRKGSDLTGIIDIGQGGDEQALVLADLTAKHAWEAWGELVVRRYIKHRCDCVVVERNRGGDAVAANIRTCAKEIGWTVQILERDAPTRHTPGVIYVKEVNSSRSKEVRAEPVATAYERGRVSHVRGADLAELEDVMTTWLPEPGAESPDRIDALVHGVWELLKLGTKVPDQRSGFVDVEKANAEIAGDGGFVAFDTPDSRSVI